MARPRPPASKTVIMNSTSFFANLPLAYLTAVSWAFIAFLVGRVVKRHATIDIFWGSGFLMVLLESLFVSRAWSHSAAAHPWWAVSHHARVFRLIVLICVALWSLRLSIYLAIRQRGSAEDPRYLYIMRGARGRNENLYALMKIYLLQGTLMWFVSLPLQWMAFAKSFNAPLVSLGVALVAIGLFFEAVGDGQLRRFAQNPANAGTTMSSGLWKYTRHPNYFGDSVVWWGLYLMAMSTGIGAATILSPLVMTWLLTRLSGVPMLEVRLRKTRAGYEEYVARTSAFFPRPPKKA